MKARLALAPSSVALVSVALLAGCIEPAQQVIRDTSGGSDTTLDATTDGAPGDVDPPDDTSDTIAGDTTVPPDDSGDADDDADITTPPTDVAVETDVAPAPVITLERISPEEVSYFPGSELREPLRFRVVAEGQDTPPPLSFSVETAGRLTDDWRSVGEAESGTDGKVVWAPGVLPDNNDVGFRIRFTTAGSSGVQIEFRLHPTRVVDLSLGPRHGCLVTSTQELMCWGENGPDDPTTGLTARPMTEALRGGLVPDPMRVPTPGPVTGVAAFGGFDEEPNGSGADTQTTCISVRSEDTSVSGVYCAGHGTMGENGNGSAADSSGWVRVVRAADGGPAPLPAAREVSGAGRLACAIIDDTGNTQGVWCWGRGEDGQLGAATRGEGPKTSARAVLVISNDGGQHLEGLETGPGNVCVRRMTTESASSGLPTGHVVCWGSDAELQLGQAEATPSGVPIVVFPSPMPPLCDGLAAAGVAVDGLLAFSVGPVAVGGAHICARVRTDGIDGNQLPRIIDACGADAVAASVVCAGDDDEGQRGSSASSEIASYVELQDGSLATGFVHLAAGLAFTCGLEEGGQVFCWGSNSDGQLGERLEVVGDLYYADPVPLARPNGGSGGFFAHAIDAGPHHVCVIAGPQTVVTMNDRVLCWGRAAHGVSGDDPCLRTGAQEGCPDVPRALVLR